MSARNASGAFFDTNILVYRVAPQDWRYAQARTLVAEGGFVSVQVLNEFVNVTRRKFRLDWELVQSSLESIRMVCNPVLPMTDETHRKALDLAMQYGFGIYDATIIASALLAGCATLYSEDMQDGQRIDALTIRNPFSAKV